MPSAAASASADPSPQASRSLAPSPSAQPSGAPTTGLPQGADPVTLDPANFVAVIDNPYLPLPVGAKWTYTETDSAGDVQTITVEVTAETRAILGITATVVHDIVMEGDEVIEDTFDWYAQDTAGNVWYLGEDTKELEGGEVVSTEGSWEAGVDGAQPGVIMPADPAAGSSYRQEHYAGQAEDEATILFVGERVAVGETEYEDVVVTRDTTPLEPDVVELKFYAPGVGLVLELGISPELTREELTEVSGL
jgi:hypothetical protein